MLPRHPALLALAPLLLLTACGGDGEVAAAPTADRAVDSAPVPVDAADPSAGSTSGTDTADDDEQELRERAERLVVVRDGFLERPARQDPAVLDEVSVGDLRRNLGRSGETLPLVDERAYGFVGGTGVEWVEVTELSTDPVTSPVDGVEGVTGTAVVAICQDNSAIEAVDEAGEVLEGVSDIADHTVAGFRFVHLDDGPAGEGWYASSGLAEAPEVERSCPED
ncbi:hypothetical protein [Aquipuribacter sp. SD81]|uniref:hypothetical protein n=1 Tax=Aquipuribacter sp. SD81 TaxID=3127703 RepID=UPI0030188109